MNCSRSPSSSPCGRWTTWLSSRSPRYRRTTHATLALVGLLDAAPTEMPAIGPIESPRAPTRNALHLDRITALISRPADHFREVYGWGTADFDALALFTRLQRLLLVTGQVQAVLITRAGAPPLLEAYVFGFSVDESVSPPRLTVGVRFPGTQTTSDVFPLTDPWSLRVTATGAFVEDIQAVVAAPFDVTLTPPAGTIEIAVTAALVATPAAGTGPVLLLGAADEHSTDGRAGVALGRLLGHVGSAGESGYRRTDPERRADGRPPCAVSGRSRRLPGLRAPRDD